MPHLEISLLGPFQVRLDGVPVTQFGTDSARALLAYLAVDARTPRRRQALAGLLWPDHPESAARHNLSQALLRLRAAIGDRDASPPFLLSTRETIQLNPDGETWLDVDAFSQTIADSKGHAHRRLQDCAVCAERLQKATALYRGDFLSGFSLPSAPFEEWVVVERERLHRQALAALAALAAYHERRGAYREAIACARRQVALEPWREEAHRQWMRALALSGQRSAALAQYEACERILRAELGVAPSQETTDLVARIRDGSSLQPSPIAPAPTGNLVAQSTPFVGRERELAEVHGLLVDGDVRLVTVVGMGGMGKTRLALEAARIARSCFPAGTWWVDLASLADEALVPRAVAAALGVQERPDGWLHEQTFATLGAQERPSRPLTEVIADALQTRALLLVLDNCEHVVEGVARLANLLLTRCPELTVLATSREPLHVPGEHLYEVPPMGLPPADTLPERLLDADAVQLFCQRAAAVRQDFSPLENAPLAAEVCRQLDGMPLAIELSAARMRSLSLAAIGQHLDDRFRLLTGGSRTAHSRQRTLGNTLAWSVDLLDDDERTLFVRLSVFAGSLDLEKAREVCCGPEVPAEAVLDLLSRLVDKSLVSVARAKDGAIRYRLLETVRAYARERLASRGEADEIAARHAWSYVTLAEGLESQFSWDREMKPALERIDAEVDNLAAAMRWSLSSRQPEVALRIGSALKLWAYVRLQHMPQYAEWVGRALAQRAPVASRHRARALSMVALWASVCQGGDANRAAACREEALALARGTGDPRVIGRAVCDVAWSAMGTDQPARALALAQEALQIGRELEDRVLVLDAKKVQALMAPMPVRRFAMFEEMLALAPYYSQSFDMLQLGHSAHALGDLERAKDWFRGSLERGGELDMVGLHNNCLVGLAKIAMLRGSYAEALALLERGQALLRRIGDTFHLVDVVWLMGSVAWRQGDLGQATQYLDQGIRLVRERGYTIETSLPRLMLALVACEQGAYDRAEALCAGVLDAPSYADPYGRGLASSALARVALCRDDPGRAVALGRMALGHMQRHQCRPDIVEALEPLSWALAADGQAREAMRLLACAARQRAQRGMALAPVDRQYHERAVEAARGALGEEAFAATWAEGETLDLDEAVAIADP